MSKMIDTYNIFVVAYHRFTRSNIVCGIFPNEKYAREFRDAFHSTAKIYLVNRNDIYLGDYGIDMRENIKPIA